MPIQDLRLEIHPGKDDLGLSIAVIGVSSHLDSEAVGTIRLNVHQGYLQIEIEKEKDWISPIETMIA